MFNRPKTTDTDDDILRMQAIFNAEKGRNAEFTPAAKLVNPRKHKSDETTSVEAKHSRCDVKPAIQDDKVYFPSVIPSVLGAIVEKNVNDHKSSERPSTSALPKTNTSTSLFAQRIKNKRNAVKTESDVTMKTEAISKIVPNRSVIVTGADSMDIHNANKAIIDDMTEEEILAEKEKLLSMLNPKTIEFIKSLRQTKKSETKPEPKQVEVVKMETDVRVEDLEVSNDVLSHPSVSEWVNFDRLEKDKLEWIKDVNLKESVPEDKDYEARFDFRGYLQPYSAEYKEENKILFHHGEDPHRPGYSLNELFQLCRSTVVQQRVLALKTIAGILDYHSLGVYNGVIEIPVTKIFFVLRFALDENIPMILEPTLKALRNMFYYKVEESCLDMMLCADECEQPRLISTKSDAGDGKEDEAELKDFHLAEIDLIDGALRTDILTRIGYILNVLKPGFIAAECCLQVLIRIARDSPQNSKKILDTANLMKTIYADYLPTFIKTKDFSKSNSEHHKLVACALKLSRVLTSQSKPYLIACISNYKLIDSLLYYICGITPETVFTSNIQIEAFHHYSALLKCGLGAEHLNTIATSLYNIVNSRDLDLTQAAPNIMYSYGTALFVLLSHMFRSNSDYVRVFENFMHQTVRKICVQIASIDKYSLVHLNFASAVFEAAYFMLSTKHSRELYVNMQIETYLSNLIKSEGFTRVVSKLNCSSNLLSKVEMYKHANGTNIFQLQALSMNPYKELLPTLNQSSPVYFTSSLAKLISKLGNNALSSELIRHKLILSYVKRLSDSKVINLTDSWFTRVEFDLICNVLNLYVDLDLDDDLKDIAYILSYKLSYTLTVPFKNRALKLFKRLIFDKKWFTTERFMKNLNVADSDNFVDNLDEIRDCYITILNLNSPIDECLTLCHWNQPILPRDWIYMPILGLYTKGCDSDTVALQKSNESVIKSIVSCCLQWILVSEIYFPDITCEITLTDRFCRLICVYLCDNSIFLDPAIKSLMGKCLKIIFDYEKAYALNFDAQLSGISNFQDLYSQLINQFQAVSYGDHLFASCVLVPLANRHNINWRKLIWSEYASCLRFLDCPEDLLCYPISEYLNPPERDFSLLKCYHRALNSNTLRRGTVSYKIAEHHIEMVKQRSGKPNKN